MKTTLKTLALMAVALIASNLMASTAIAEAPKAIDQMIPTYPEQMKAQGIQGSVLLEGLVDTDGNLLGLTAVESSNEDFEKSALEAISQWNLEPAKTEDGEAIEVVVRIPVSYELNKVSLGMLPGVESVAMGQ